MRKMMLMLITTSKAKAITRATVSLLTPLAITTFNKATYIIRVFWAPLVLKVHLNLIKLMGKEDPTTMKQEPTITKPVSKESHMVATLMSIT